MSCAYSSSRRRIVPDDTRVKVLNYLRDYIAAHQFPPTVREIAAGVGISSTSVVNYHLRRLAETGRIERIQGAARAIRVVEA